MNRVDAVRLVAMLGAIEMCLVRRDAVTGPLLAQAARAAEGTSAAPYVQAAARLVRAHDLTARTADVAPVRKVTQALCRAAAQEAQAAALEGGGATSPTRDAGG
mgnify:CR=1 FL=1